METQKAVFIDASPTPNLNNIREIIKEILKADETPVPHETQNEHDSYLWNAETKYYKAKINLTVLKKKSIVSEKFADNVEATLLYFDSSKKSNWAQDLGSWLPYVDSWNPEIKLAVCERCDRDGEEMLGRVEVQTWCLEHGFELVELEPDPEDFDEYEDVGVKRIRNALLAHMWPNMTMKNRNEAVKKIQPTACGTNVENSLSSDRDPTLAGGPFGGEGLDDLLGNAGEDDFEKLFCKMSVMKERAESLPSEQRKKFAEDMVLAFWTALGGNEEEIEGLSSSNEEETEEKT